MKSEAEADVTTDVLVRPESWLPLNGTVCSPKGFLATVGSGAGTKRENTQSGLFVLVECTVAARVLLQQEGCKHRVLGSPVLNLMDLRQQLHGMVSKRDGEMGGLDAAAAVHFFGASAPTPSELQACCNKIFLLLQQPYIFWCDSLYCKHAVINYP